MYAELGDTQRAVQTAIRAVDNDPTLIETHWILIGLYLVNKDHARVAETLDLVGQRFETEWEDLSQIPEYAEFANSPEGKRWIEAHR